MLAMRNPEVPVYVDSSRIAAADTAEKQDNPDVLVLDDAYQHLAIHRDLNLLLIDAEHGLENRNLIPYGNLREPASQWHGQHQIDSQKTEQPAATHGHTCGWGWSSVDGGPLLYWFGPHHGLWSTLDLNSNINTAPYGGSHFQLPDYAVQGEQNCAWAWVK